MVIYQGGSKLLLNTDKTEVMAIGTLAHLRLLDSDLATSSSKLLSGTSELILTILSPRRTKSAAFIALLFLN